MIFEVIFLAICETDWLNEELDKILDGTDKARNDKFVFFGYFNIDHFNFKAA